MAYACTAFRDTRSAAHAGAYTYPDADARTNADTGAYTDTQADPHSGSKHMQLLRRLRYLQLLFRPGHLRPLLWRWDYHVRDLLWQWLLSQL